MSKGSRRWAIVEQDVLRLAALGLSDAEIAERVEVDRATVFRWRKAGKLSRDGAKPDEVAAKRNEVLRKAGSQTASEWAAAVRASYALDATDEQLVTLAESTLITARDPGATASLRLQAMRTFQGLVKQLALVARAADEKPAEEPKRKTFALRRRSNVDPREILKAVN